MYNTRAFVLLLIPVCVSMLWHLLLRSKNVEYHQQKVFVAVLSARDHFEHRQAIRSTWASGNFLPNKTTVRFILGTNSCSIPKSYRQSSFNCQPLLSGDRLKQTDGEQILNSQRLVGNLLPSPKINRRSIYRGFAFLTLFDIQLHSVGILECAFQNRKELKNINIQLKDAIAQKLIVSIDVNRFLPVLDGHLHFEINQTLRIPAGTIVEIIADELAMNNACRDFQTIQDHPQLIKFLKVLDPDFTKLENHSNDSLILVSIRYNVSDFQSILNRSDHYEAAVTEHQTVLNQERQQLIEEQKAYGDLIFLDQFEDTYVNLPQKLLKTIDYVVNREFSADFFLKTDDDVYLNLPNLIEQLDLTQNAWYGSFRKHWQVNEYGKWAELDYQSLTYPPFACGAGYVITSDLMKWIASNSNRLHTFQGEDVSIGIWLSAIHPQLAHDNRWFCNRTLTSRDFFSIAQLDPRHLHQIHEWLHHDRN